MSLERVEAATAVIRSAADPAETAEEQSGKRADEMIDRISDAAIAELRTLRDDIDNQIRAIVARRDQLKSDIAEQVVLAQQAIDIRQVASDAVVRLTKTIEQGMGPVPKVITARRVNGQGK